MKKRIALLLLSTAVMLGMAACGGKKPEKETTQAVTADMTTEKAEATTEKVEESTEEAKTETESALKVISLKGPTSIGLVHLMEKAEKDNLPYSFQMEASPDALLPEFVSGKADIATVPANMAAVLYQKLNKDLYVLNINTLGVLYGVSGNAEVKAFSDLEGKTYLSTGQGASPEYLMNTLLKKNSIHANAEFYTDVTEIAAKLKENPEAVAILPEPFATATLLQNSALERKFSLTEEWNKIFPGTELPTAVTIVKKSFYEENKDRVQAFLKEEQESIEAVEKDTDTTAALMVKYGILEKEELAKKAIPNCNVHFIDGEDMKKDLEQYFTALFAEDPKSVGGALPEADFYFMH